MNDLPIARSPVSGLPDAWFTELILPPDMGRGEVRLSPRGAWPPSSPLRVQVKEAPRRDGHAIETLMSESRPGMAVPALPYVPDRAPPGKAPGVVSISGHHSPLFADDVCNLLGRVLAWERRGWDG